MSDVSIGPWPPAALAWLMAHAPGGARESAYVLGLFDEDCVTGSAVFQDAVRRGDVRADGKLAALYVGRSGEGAASLQRRLGSHRHLGIAVPRLMEEPAQPQPQGGEGDTELALLANTLGVRAPRWRLLAYWVSVPSGWEDLTAGLLRRAAARNAPRLLVLGGILPSQTLYGWQRAAALVLDAASGGACSWCHEHGHFMEACPKRVGPQAQAAVADLTASVRDELRTATASFERTRKAAQDASKRADRLQTELDTALRDNKAPNERAIQPRERSSL